MHKASRQHNLEHVAAKAVRDTLADVGAVLVVGQGAGGLAHTLEGVFHNMVAVDTCLNISKFALLAVGQQLNEQQLVAEIVENHHIFKQGVAHIGRVVLVGGAVLDGNALEVARGVERCVAVKSAVAAVVALDFELAQKLVDGRVNLVVGVDVARADGVVGEGESGLAVAHLHACHWSKGDERAVVLTSVIIRTFH